MTDKKSLEEMAENLKPKLIQLFRHTTDVNSTIIEIEEALLLAQRSGLEMGAEICWDERPKEQDTVFLKDKGTICANLALKIRAKSQELEQRGEKL